MRDPCTCGQQKTADCTGHQHLAQSTGAGAQKNTAKRKETQTPDGCIDTSASQNTAWHKGMLTGLNAQAHVHNNSMGPKGNTDALCC